MNGLRLAASRFRQIDAVLVVIVVLGAGLRLWGISFGLPYMYHPDEGVPVSIALRIVHTGNFNPGFFHWPSLLFYLNTLVYWVYFGIGHLLGAFDSPLALSFPDVEAMAVGKALLPAEFLLGRGLASFFGVLSIVWAFLIGRRIANHHAVGWLAALFLALDPLNVKHSQFIRPDILATCFALLSVLFALRILARPEKSNYILAGLAIGLTASSKYNLGLVAIAVLAAHILVFGGRFLLRREIYLAALIAVATFIVTTPYALFDFNRFWEIGPLQDAAIYSSGHPGAEGDTPQFYISFLLSTFGWLLLLALAEIAASVIQRDRHGIVLIAFPIGYYGLINFFIVHFEATILPITPFLMILAARFLHRLYRVFSPRLSVNPAINRLGIASLVLFLGVPPLQASIAHNVAILRPDGREFARVWIEEHLPPGSRIALESYSPYIARPKFVVEGLGGIQDHPPDWYIANGFEYLVFSQSIYGRYLQDATRYPNEVSRYNDLFARFPEIKRFDENNYQVRILRTGVALPPHRVAARYGDYAEQNELIGYDDLQWTRGDPLRVHLFWRTLGSEPEPFEVELRLLDAQDREIATARRDLFQGMGWRTGMFDDIFTLPVPVDAPSGQYRVQVNVIWTRYAYSLPAFNWVAERIDPVLLQSIELK